MKRIINLILLSLMFGAVWMACDKVDEPLSLIADQHFPENPDDTLYFTDSTSVAHTQVLLEDFTGHLCVNCPEWGIFAHNRAEELDHKLVIIAIHAGTYAIADDVGLYTANFSTPSGEQFFEDFDVWGNPTAMINRVEYNGSRIITTGNWGNAIDEQLAKEPVASLKLKNTFYPSSNFIAIDIDAEALSDLTGKYFVCVFITEDHFISPQKNNNEDVGPKPDWLDYEHMSILRGAINTSYGKQISETGEMITGQVYKKQYIYKIDDSWVVGNCNIVAYLYNQESFEIIQVAELGIKVDE